MTTPLKTAFHSLTQKFIHIDKADNGENCNCICPKCKEPLIAKNNGKLRTHHFSHKTETNCTGGQMTAVHFLAQQILVENEEIIIAKDKKLRYTNPIAEKPFLSKKPDVTVISEREEMFFEVWVENRKDEETKKVYRENRRRCIEMNLSKMLLDSTYEEIKFAVLEDYNNKKEIGWIETSLNTNTTSIWELIGKLALIAFILKAVYEFFKWAFSTPKRYGR